MMRQQGSILFAAATGGVAERRTVPPRLASLTRLAPRDPERRKVQPVKSSKRPVHAAALSKLKNINMAFAKAVLLRSISLEGAVLPGLEAAVVARLGNALQRRAAARDRVRPRAVGLEFADVPCLGRRQSLLDAFEEARRELKPNIIRENVSQFTQSKQLTMEHIGVGVVRTDLRPSFGRPVMRTPPAYIEALSEAMDNLDKVEQLRRARVGREDLMEQRRAARAGLKEGMLMVEARAKRHNASPSAPK